jgi:hypothetical protein
MDLLEGQEAFEGLPNRGFASDNLPGVEDQRGIGFVQRDGSVQVSALQRLVYQDVTLFWLPCWRIFPPLTLQK